MNRSPPILTNPSTYFHFCSSGLSKLTLQGQWLATRSQQMLFSSYGFGLVSRRKGRSLVVNAELSRSGLDSQTLQTNNVSEFRKIGPLPGDMAEVEAYCRILRAAENFMDMLCNPATGEFMVSYDMTQTDKPFIEDKIISVLGCLISLLNKGKEDVLCGRSLIMSAFRATDQMRYLEGKLPPLAVFRNEVKHCCESLHVAFGSFLMPDNDKSRDVWRRLQRLKNLSYDLGFPRRDDSPGHWLIANWEPVLLSNCMNSPISRECQVAFWKGGQMTEESLTWLLAEGFKTIVDINEEIVKDNFYQLALGDAIKRGEVESFHLPVEIGTAPSLEKVKKFAVLVSDESKRPIYVHSRDGVLRTSAMISAWRQYLGHPGSQIVSNGILASALKRNQLANVSSNKIEDELFKYDVELMHTHSDDRDTPNKVFSSEQLSVQKDGGRTGMAHNGTISCKAIAPEEVSDDEVQRALSMDVNPLMSQLPPHNVFCRTEMSSFFKSRKISPPSFCSEQRVLLLPASKVPYSYSNAKQTSVNGHYKTLLGAPEIASLDGSSLRQVTWISPSQNVTIPMSDGHLLRNKVVNRSDNRGLNMMKNDSSCVRNIDNGGKDFSGPNTATDEDEKNNGQSSVFSDSEDLEQVEGNMCSSTTGVVRVQSRKKAEIFLVRTDGFSCSRENVTESSLAFTHPSTQQQMLLWKSAPKTVLLLKKLGPELMEEAKEVASFLHYEENMNILVEPDVHDVLARIPGFGFVQTFYKQDTSDLHEKVDFVACLGGDGVILHASNLLRGAVPPVVSFNLGSLGFLTSHTFQEFKQDLRQIIHGNNTREGVYITLRMRLRCEIYRNGRAMPGKVFDVLNEAVVDRGSNPYLSKIECYEHGHLITKVQGDGVIVATPTGSTAYSTAAGGSMVHPNVPCMLFTPICPHSLSFRPVILPDSSQLELKIPEDARSNAWVSFDGKRRQQLCRGDSVKISMSRHPLPTVNKSDQTGDWFHSLICCLNWNERLEQKAL